SPIKMAYTCAKPPSTNNSVPVMWLLSLDARNTTALAISLGVPSLPRWNIARNHLHALLARACGSYQVVQSGRVDGPGLTAFTRIRRSFRSVVHVRAKERTAAFVAL